MPYDYEATARCAANFLALLDAQREAEPRVEEPQVYTDAITVVLVRASDMQFLAGFRRDRTPVFTRDERFAKRVNEIAIEEYDKLLPTEVVLARHVFVDVAA